MDMMGHGAVPDVHGRRFRPSNTIQCIIYFLIFKFMERTKTLHKYVGHTLHALMLALLFLWCGNASAEVTGTGTKADPYIFADDIEGTRHSRWRTVYSERLPVVCCIYTCCRWNTCNFI